MRYSVPVNAPDEVAALAAAGAGELYVGYLDAWWVERYGDHDSASRRQGRANLSSPEELRDVVRAARTHGLPINLALNARYTEPQLDHLQELCTRFAQWGGTGVILSDMGLLWRLRNQGGPVADLDITLSLLAVAQNAETLKAYRRLGVTRVVLPRFVGWEEAATLLAAVPGVEASAMAFFDKCPLVDGYCRHRHGVSYPDRVMGNGGGITHEAAGDATAPPLYTFDTTYRTHACLGRSCTYLEPYPCAACHLTYYERAGVNVAKLGGRGRPLEERLRALRFLRKAEGMGCDDERAKLYHATFGQPCACYYGAHTQSRYAIEPVETPADARSRVRVGSQTSYDAYRQALARLCRGELPPCEEGLTLLVPPLADEGQAALVSALPTLAAQVPRGTHVAVNDVGTLVALTRTLAAVEEAAGGPWALKPMLGTLLARLDDPDEVEHFLSPSGNPSRPVWDTEGRARTLTYAPPPDSLVRHWKTPSLTEPSAQAGLAWLTGLDVLEYEFTPCRAPAL